MDITKKMLKKMGLPFPDWHVVEEIGNGTFGSVFRIESRQGEVCALKVIPVPYSESSVYDAMQSYGDIEQVRNSFNDQVNTILTREIGTAKQCASCPYIFRIFEEAVVDDLENRAIRYIMVRMEMLSELKPYMNSPGMRQRDVLHLMENIATALVFLEGKHILHRDIKPANIMVDRQGLYKLTDFGEARVTRQDASHTIARGTPYYMAPEVRTSSRYDRRADIYSLGMVAYYLLNHMTYPFGQFGIRPREGYERRMNGETCPPIPNVDAKINNVVLKCVAYRPEQRYQSASELLQDLRELLQDRSVGQRELSATSTGGGSHPPRTDRRSGSGNSGSNISGRSGGSGNTEGNGGSTSGTGQQKSGLSTTAIVLIVVGSVLLFIIIVALISASTPLPLNIPAGGNMNAGNDLFDLASQLLGGNSSPIQTGGNALNTIAPLAGH